MHRQPRDKSHTGIHPREMRKSQNAVFSGCSRMFPAVCFVLLLITVNGSHAQQSRWNAGLYGAAQWSTADRTNWYTVGEGYSSEAGVNGLEDGASYGIEIGLEYRIMQSMGIEVSFGYMPTNIHGGTHQTWQRIFAEPSEHILFLPIHVAANVYLFNDEKWNIAVAPLVGVGLIGDLDLRPFIGKARHFNGKNGFLWGGQFVVSRAITSSGWSVLASLKYMSTTYEVSEIGTGALRQDLPMRPLSLRLGMAYSL